MLNSFPLQKSEHQSVESTNHFAKKICFLTQKRQRQVGGWSSKGKYQCKIPKKSFSTFFLIFTAFVNFFSKFCSFGHSRGCCLQFQGAKRFWTQAKMGECSRQQCPKCTQNKKNNCDYERLPHPQSFLNFYPIIFLRVMRTLALPPFQPRPTFVLNPGWNSKKGAETKIHVHTVRYFLEWWFHSRPNLILRTRTQMNHWRKTTMTTFDQYISIWTPPPWSLFCCCFQYHVNKPGQIMNRVVVSEGGLFCAKHSITIRATYGNGMQCQEICMLGHAQLFLPVWKASPCTMFFLKNLTWILLQQGRRIQRWFHSHPSPSPLRIYRWCHPPPSMNENASQNEDDMQILATLPNTLRGKTNPVGGILQKLMRNLDHTIA